MCLHRTVTDMHQCMCLGKTLSLIFPVQTEIVRPEHRRKRSALPAVQGLTVQDLSHTHLVFVEQIILICSLTFTFYAVRFFFFFAFFFAFFFFSSSSITRKENPAACEMAGTWRLFCSLKHLWNVWSSGDSHEEMRNLWFWFLMLVLFSALFFRYNRIAREWTQKYAM